MCVGEGANPKVTQQSIVRQAGVANHSMLPYFPEHKQKAHDVKLQPAAPPPLPGLLSFSCCLGSQLTTSLKNISVCFGLTLHENLNTRGGGHGERELCLFKDELSLTAVIFNS